MIELKLPLKTICRCKEPCSCGVWNGCIDKVKELNPSGWEVDEEAIIDIFSESLGRNAEILRLLAKALIKNETKWLKPVDEVNSMAVRSQEDSDNYDAGYRAGLAAQNEELIAKILREFLPDVNEIRIKRTTRRIMKKILSSFILEKTLAPDVEEILLRCQNALLDYQGRCNTGVWVADLLGDIKKILNRDV